MEVLVKVLTDNELRFPGWDSVREWNAKCGVLCCIGIENKRFCIGFRV